MLWRLTLAVVCVGATCSCMKADLMSRLMMPRDYGVKLCGREFIRAVIFTCGGSRWRRSPGGGAEPFQWSSLRDVTAEGRARSLADLLALHGATGDGPSLADSALQQTRALAAADDGGGVTSKKKRNFSLGVAGKCCNQGCTKNDIGRLC
ncbi:prorelaxin H1 [Spinachia spinachia]